MVIFIQADEEEEYFEVEQFHLHTTCVNNRENMDTPIIKSPPVYFVDSCFQFWQPTLTERKKLSNMIDAALKIR